MYDILFLIHFKINVEHLRSFFESEIPFSMAIQLNEPSPSQFREQSRSRRHLSRSRLILTLVILLLAGGIFLVVLNLLQIVTGSWYILIPVVFTGLGLVFASLQWLFPVDPSLTATTHNPGMFEINPLIDPQTILREREVEEVYALLSDSATSAVVLRGINGIGKSTLAKLVLHYSETRRAEGTGAFTERPLWLHIEAHFSFIDVAEAIALALKKQLPNFNGLSPQHQAEQLIKVINSTKTRRLIILDFKYPLDGLAEGALADKPCFKEWLKALNSQSCTSHILFTSCPWSPNSSSYPQEYIQEYYVEGLKITEGIELLQICGIEATADELGEVIQMCDGHVGALYLLIMMLHDRHINLETFLGDRALIQIWMREIASNFLQHIYQRFDPVQRKLLFAFSIYRKPVPIEGAQAIVENETQRVDLLIALPKLIKLHLLRTTNKKDTYQLHLIVADYVRSISNDISTQGSVLDLKTAHMKAAQYYQTTVEQHFSLGKTKHKFDEEMLVEAVWHLLKADQVQEAYTLVQKAKLLEHLINMRH